MEEEYSAGELARMAGVSVRTLHHYEQLGLLAPGRKPNGYRVYGAVEAERLQQVLLYREMGVQLADIRKILDDPAFDPKAALERHLKELKARSMRLEGLIGSVERMLRSLEGGAPMSTEEKFEALKQSLVEKNEREYGAEARERWGDAAVDAANAKVRGLTREEWQSGTELEAELRAELVAAVEAGGDPADAHARRAAELHAEWLRLCWPDGMYTPAAHLGLAETYLTDERFKAYYDAWAPEATQVLVEAVKRLHGSVMSIES